MTPINNLRSQEFHDKDKSVSGMSGDANGHPAHYFFQAASNRRCSASAGLLSNSKNEKPTSGP